MPPKKKGKKKGPAKPKEKPDQNLKQQLDLTKHQLDLKIVENNDNKEISDNWKHKQLDSEYVHGGFSKQSKTLKMIVIFTLK